MTRIEAARDPQKPRILIARLSAIGDTILTTPVACRLRDRFPEAHLAWVVEEKSSHFVKGHPALDETFVAPRGWFTNPRQAGRLRAALRAGRFDVAVDCQGLTKSALACWLSGARLRVGLRGRYGAELSPWLNNSLVRPRHPHVTDRSLELLSAIGIPHDPDGEPVRWDLPVDPGARASVDEWLASQRIDRFMAINPGASWDSKLWSNDRFARVAAWLWKERDLPSVVVWGGGREQDWAEEIVAKSNGAARLAPPTSLHELAALLSRARLLLSPDTGPMHLGVAVGTPTVGLHGVTRPEDCGPYGAPHVGLLKRFQAGSRKERRRADNAAMLEISAEDAYGACQRVLGRTADRLAS